MISISELESRFKKETENFMTDILKVFNNIKADINEKEYAIILKNLEIEKLKSENQQMKEELNKCLNTIDTLKRDLEFKSDEIKKLGKIYEGGDLDIIYKPNDVLNYSENIITQYIENVDFKQIDFININEFLTNFIDYKQWDILDSTIIKIVDEKVENLTNQELILFLEFLKDYLKKQIEIESYSVKGIIYFINKINNLRWTKLIEDFIDDNYKDIEFIIGNIDHKYRDIPIIEMLKVYFLLSKDKLASNLIELIIYYNMLVNIDEIDLTSLLEMFLIFIYYEKDGALFNNLEELTRSIINLGVPSIKIYKIYIEKKNKIVDIESKLNRIGDLRKINDNINYDIKTKVYDRICSNLESIKREKEEIENIPVVGSLFRIKNKKKCCPYDETILQYKLCKINYYDSYDNSIEGNIEARVLYCSKCNKYFANHDIIKEIEKNNHMKEYRLNIKPIKNSKSAVVQKKPSYDYTVQGSLTNVNTNSSYERSEVNLNPKSDLAALGYSTQLSRKERWRILTEKAIPKIGVSRTIGHISWLIRLKKADKLRDYSRAISEWEYDLKMIKNKYSR